MKRSSNFRKEFVLKKAVQSIKLSKDDMALQVGSDQGILIELLHDKVKECHAVEPNERLAKTLARRYRGMPNVLIQHARPTNVPYPNHYFSKIILHELSLLVSSELELRRVCDELARVASENAVIFIGGIAMTREPRTGFGETLRRQAESWLARLKQSGQSQSWLSHQIETLLQRWGVSSHSLFLSEKQVLSLCRQYGLDGSALRIELTHALSLSRTDILLRRIHAEEPTRSPAMSYEPDTFRNK